MFDAPGPEANIRNETVELSIKRVSIHKSHSDQYSTAESHSLANRKLHADLINSAVHGI